MANQALLIERGSDGLLAPNQNVLFDHTLFSDGSITYDNLTGELVFERPGRYVFNWTVSLQSATTVGGTLFSFHSSQGDVIRGNSPGRTGNINGMGVINVTAPPVTAYLAYEGTGDSYYATTVPVKAVFMLFEDPTPGMEGTSLCIASEQMVHMLRQVISLYPTETVSVFTTGLLNGSGRPYQLVASPDANDAGIFVIQDDTGTLGAFPVSLITGIYVGGTAVYDPSITYISPPSPLPPGCDTNVIAAVQTYLTVGEEVQLRMGTSVTASGLLYRNEYGVVVLANADGSNPLFIPTDKILYIEITDSDAQGRSSGKVSILVNG